MPPKLKQRQIAAVPQTHVVKPTIMRIQTSGSEFSRFAILIHADLCRAVFKFPLELFLEVFSYLADHRRFIRENYCGREPRVRIGRKDAERSVVTRRLTMTCWPLRNLLLPLLWTDVEGCTPHSPYNYNTKRGGLGSSPYAQCVYLASTPAIATYVRYVRFYLLRSNVVYEQ